MTLAAPMVRIWDPNPQLKDIALGEATVFRWKDKSGRDWEGGLFKPVPSAWTTGVGFTSTSRLTTSLSTKRQPLRLEIHVVHYKCWSYYCFVTYILNLSGSACSRFSGRKRLIPS